MICHRADLVPVYSFGENELFQQVIFSEGSVGRRLQDLFKKIMGFAPCLFVGERLAFIPYRIPITMVGEFVIILQPVTLCNVTFFFFFLTPTFCYFQWEAQSLCQCVRIPPRRRWTTITDFTWKACQSYSMNIRSAVDCLKVTCFGSFSLFSPQHNCVVVFYVCLAGAGWSLWMWQTLKEIVWLK